MSSVHVLNSQIHKIVRYNQHHQSMFTHENLYLHQQFIHIGDILRAQLF